jgi:hypothetical protein
MFYHKVFEMLIDKKRSELFIFLFQQIPLKSIKSVIFLKKQKRKILKMTKKKN